MFNSEGAFIKSEGAASERVFSRLIPSRENFEISLRPILEEGKAHLFPGSSSDSDGGINWDTFSRLEHVTLLAGTFGVPEQASNQI